MNELKPCPFCGTSMKLWVDKYPNGDARIEPHGWHDKKCPIAHLLWCYDVEEDGWTEEMVSESWNMRNEAVY